MSDAKPADAATGGSATQVRCKAAVFDLDGTLLDTLAAIADAANFAMKSVGRPTHPVESYNLFAGQGLPNMIRDALGPGHHELFDDAVAAHRKRYASHALGLTQPFAGIPKLLQALAAADVPVCVLSNKLHDAVLADLDHFLADVPWHTRVGLRDGYEPKPDTAAAKEIAEALGLSDDPGSIAYVGDTAADMLTASGCGFWSIGVLWGFRDEGELRANGADAIVSDVAELQELLLGAAGE